MDDCMRELRLQMLGEQIYSALRPSPLIVRLRGKDLMSSGDARKIADGVVKELRIHPEKEEEFYRGLVEDMRDTYYGVDEQ